MPTTSKSDLLLGLDLGTTNVKVLVTDRDGAVIARGSAPVPLQRGSHDDGQEGAVEQDLATIWRATATAIGQAVNTVDGRSIAAVGISSQGGALQITDAQYQPLLPVISWLDGRGQPFGETLMGDRDQTWRMAHIGSGHSGNTIGQIARLHHEQPGLLQAPHRVHWVGDLIARHLCGIAVHDTSSLSIALMLNPHRGDTDPQMLKLLKLKREQLPVVHDVRQPAGGLLPEVAASLGLVAGIPVSAAVHDQYAAALGCAAVEAGDVMLGTGTAWVLLALTPGAPQKPMPEAFTCPHPVPGRWGQMLAMSNGGAVYAWACEVLGLGDADREALLQAAPPGCDNLRFCPLLAPMGSLRVATHRRGSFDGLTLHHGPAHLLRAVVEGLAMELSRYLAMLEETGLQPQRLITGGGVTQSPTTCRILADTIGLPLACVNEPALSALGAAVIARGLLEPEADLAHLAHTMAATQGACVPGPDGDLYQQLARAYRQRLNAG